MIINNIQRQFHQKKIFNLSLLSGIFFMLSLLFMTLFQFMPRYDLNIFWATAVVDFYYYNFFNLILGFTLSYLVLFGFKVRKQNINADTKNIVKIVNKYPTLYWSIISGFIFATYCWIFINYEWFSSKHNSFPWGSFLSLYIGVHHPVDYFIVGFLFACIVLIIIKFSLKIFQCLIKLLNA